MERFALTGCYHGWRSAVFVWLVLALSGSALALAQPQPRTSASAPAVPLDNADVPHPQHQRALKKVREGAMLRRDWPRGSESIDWRSEMERERDAEVVKHYQRMAELDVIAEIARRRRDAALSEEIDAVRLREDQRFQAAMQRLRERSERLAMSGRL